MNDRSETAVKYLFYTFYILVLLLSVLEIWPNSTPYLLN